MSQQRTDAGRAPSLWLERNAGTRVPASAIRHSADVVVVGGGVVGVSVAYWLGRFGVDVVLLESRELGWGASGRNAGFMLAGSSPLEDMTVMLANLGEEEIDAGYEEVGHLALATTEAVVERIKDEIGRRPASAPPLHLLDRAECEHLLGRRLDRGFLAGRWLPSAAAVDPVRLVVGLAGAARRRGVALVRTAALGIRRAGSGLEVDTHLGRIRSRYVVVACGAWTGRVMPAVARLIEPTRGQMLATAPAQPVLRVGIAVNWGSVYCRQLRTGEILIGGLREVDPAPERTSTIGLNHRIQSALSTFLSEALPGFSAPEVRWRWAGIMDVTRDGRPLVGPCPGADGVWLAAGFGGHGLPPAFGAGRLVAESICKGEVREEIGALDPGRAALEEAA
jgi:gamma-glutamylputrescine oxidase